MNSNEWQIISDRFERALELPAAQRRAYLDELARTESAAVCREVEALLKADQDSEEFLNTNAMRLTARHLAEHETPIQPHRSTRYGWRLHLLLSGAP